MYRQYDHPTDSEKNYVFIELYWGSKDNKDLLLYKHLVRFLGRWNGREGGRILFLRHPLSVFRARLPQGTVLTHKTRADSGKRTAKNELVTKLKVL